MPWPSDPALPQLAVLRDLDAVTALLPGWRVTRRLHVRYAPGRSCVATYELELLQAGPGTARSVGVVAVEPDGVSARLYADDPALPGLAEVAEGRALPRLGLDGGVATPVRYRPAARCTLSVSGGQDSVEAFAKVLVEAERLRSAAAQLHRAGVPVPEEVAWWPDLGCLVQRAVPGATPLGPALVDRTDVAAAAGEALARMHAVDAEAWPGPVVGVADDVARLDRLRAPVAAAVAELLPRYDGALAAVRSAAGGGAGPEAAPVPGHGAYRSGQLLLDADGRVVVLDLDGACHAEPARDVGNFLAHLRWQAVRHPADAGGLEAARTAFLDGYRSVRPAPDSRRLALHEAASLVKIAGRRARDLSTDEWPLLPTLLDQAAEAGR